MDCKCLQSRADRLVSLAFVISFVVSAVAMLIGIVIYSDVADAMTQTFVASPELTQNFGQNGFGEIKTVSNDTILIASTYTGLNTGSTISKITLPVDGVEDSIIIKPPHKSFFDGSEGDQPTEQVTTTSAIGVSVWRVHIITSADGLIAGQLIDEIKLQSYSSGSTINAHIGIYDSSTEYITQSDIVNVTPNDNFYTFTFSPPFAVPINEHIQIMLASDTQFYFKGLDIPTTGDWNNFGSNTVSVEFPNLPLDWEADVSASSLGQPNMRIQVDSILPRQFEVGLYDSSFNLLGSQSGSVTTDEPQDIIVTLSSPVTIPNDGIVSIGLFGEEQIEFLGDSTNSLLSSGVSGIEDPFIVDTTETLAVLVGDEVVSSFKSDYIWGMADFNTASGIVAGDSVIAVELQSATSGSSFNMTVGLYDSFQGQLLGVSDEVNVTPNGNFYTWTFSPPVTIPLAEIISVKTFANSIDADEINDFWYLQGVRIGEGSFPTYADRFNTYPTFPDPYVAEIISGTSVGHSNTRLIKTFDGLEPSSQRTIIEVFSGQVLDTPPAFAQADNIALTVIGVLPVALFFVSLVLTRQMFLSILCLSVLPKFHL